MATTDLGDVPWQAWRSVARPEGRQVAGVAGPLAGGEVIGRGSLDGPPPYPDLAADPPGWERLVSCPAPTRAVGSLTAWIARDIDGLTDRAVRRITSAVPAYAHVDPTRRGDLWWSTKRNLQSILVILAAERHYDDHELQPRQQVATRALQRGLPLTAIMQAFRVGYVELWETLNAVATARGPAATSALLELAGLLWMSLDELSSAVSDAYNRALAVQSFDERRRALRFMSALRGLPATIGDVDAGAQELGLDLDGKFLWSAFTSPVPPEHRAFELVADTPSCTFVLVAQDDLGEHDEERLGDLLAELGATHIGVGLSRPGLQGAQLSLLDADLAHHAARQLERDQLRFRTDWLTCVLVSCDERLRAVVEPALRLLRERPDTATTLAEFLESQGSLAETGRRLHVHPNTVAYRIERFRQLTGVDPRSSEGSAQASAILTLRAVADGAGPP